MTGSETVILLDDLPLSDPGATMPVVFATEQIILVAYRLARPAMDANDGTGVGLVEFRDVDSHLFGSPNDESLSGHRLYKLGLKPYSFHRVDNSEWIAQLCERNRVHPHHRDERFADLKHFVFTFHDTTFEIVAKTYAAYAVQGSPLSAIRERIAGAREDGLT